MDIFFEKWHGCSNDFIILRLTDADGEIVLNSLRRSAPTMCDRHIGIGADGILVLWVTHRNQDIPYKLSIINKDGSIARNCGNGLRCAASSIYRNFHAIENKKNILELLELEVEGEKKICKFLKTHKDHCIVSVDMGIPLFNDQLPWWEEAKTHIKKLLISLDLEKNIQNMAACELGNKHLILTMEKASQKIIRLIGPALQDTPYWDGINVHVIENTVVTEKDQALAKRDVSEKISDLYRAYVWERGVGETMACGSGAAAIGRTIIETGLIEENSWIGVEMPGGRLYTRQEVEESYMQLAGPAMFVFRGTVTI